MYFNFISEIIIKNYLIFKKNINFDKIKVKKLFLLLKKKNSQLPIFFLQRIENIV